MDRLAAKRKDVLSPGEIKRYSRHLILPEVGMAGQLKLKQSSALIIGAGGLGVPLTQYLSAAGAWCPGVGGVCIVVGSEPRVRGGDKTKKERPTKSLKRGGRGR